MSWKIIKQKFEIDYIWSVICVYTVWFLFRMGVWSGVDSACFVVMSFGVYLYLLRPIGKGIIEILLAFKIRNQLFNLLAEDFGV